MGNNRHKHDWHLYNFTEAALVDVGRNAKQFLPARFNFVCGECGETRHHPPIKDGTEATQERKESNGN